MAHYHLVWDRRISDGPVLSVLTFCGSISVPQWLCDLPGPACTHITVLDAQHATDQYSPLNLARHRPR